MPTIEIGIDSFISAIGHKPETRLPPQEVMRNFLDRVVYADEAGLDVFGVGEHHREEFLDSAPVVLLAAAAARTKQIRLTSAVTVLSAADPVRVFEAFATLDIVSNGRAEIVAGRGSFTEAFPLFGLDLNDYDSLYAENLDLVHLPLASRNTSPGRLAIPQITRGIRRHSLQHSEVREVGRQRNTNKLTSGILPEGVQTAQPECAARIAIGVRQKTRSTFDCFYSIFRNVQDPGRHRAGGHENSPRLGGRHDDGVRSRRKSN